LTCRSLVALKPTSGQPAERDNCRDSSALFFGNSAAKYVASQHAQRSICCACRVSCLGSSAITTGNLRWMMKNRTWRPNPSAGRRAGDSGSGPVHLGLVFEFEIIVVKLLRACGGCLGARRLKGVEGCDKSGGVVKQALIPEYPSKPRELKHLSTWRKRKKPRFP
jgi:hypothetical protein